MEERHTYREMAEALDEMDKSLSSENADFLEEVLKKVKKGTALEKNEEKRLERLYVRYFGDPEEEDEEEVKESVEEEIDDSDFM